MSLSLESLSTWAHKWNLAERAWLLLGKGPSFDRIKEIDTEEYFLCSLNHVVREQPVTVAHFIDIEPVLDCQNILEQNARYVVMPFHPHVGCRATQKTILEFAAEIPALRALAQQERLVWYNLDTARAQAGATVFKPHYFSSTVALDILASCGAKTVYSLGIDGGGRYSATFADLNGSSLLANGHLDFNKQFSGIAEVLRRSEILYAPWGMSAPVRIFVGTDEAQMAGVKVLEYSIKRYATISVAVQPIDNRDIPVPKAEANRSRTGFSFGRFDIPRLCGYQGRGIYLDADMQVFSDIKELWSWPLNGIEVAHADHSSVQGRLPQFSVLLLDCDRLAWKASEIIAGLDEGRYDYKQLMQQFCFVSEERKKPVLPDGWNSLERYVPGETRLLHYTDMNTQPWISHRNKNGELWYSCLREAVQDKFISVDFLNQEIEAGHLSPEILLWAGLPDPNNYARMKASFIPPYTRFTKRGVLVERIKRRLQRSDFFRHVVLQSPMVASLRRKLGV